MSDAVYDISSLLEMGIDEDIALNAMQRVQGDLEDAVNYIFSNELPEKYQQTDDSNEAYVRLDQPTNVGQDSLQPGELSNVLRPNDLIEMDSSEDENNENLDISFGIGNENDGLNVHSQPNFSVNTEESRSIDSSYSVSSEELSMRDSTNDTNDNPPSYNLIEHAIYKTEINDPTIIFPISNNSLMENYLALFALAIANYAPLPFIKPDFKNLNYDESWYKGDSMTEPLYKLKYLENQNDECNSISKSPKTELVSAELVQNQMDIQPETLWQLQKLITVSISKFSERSYVSAKLFSKSFDSNVQQKLSEAEHLYEILPTFIKSLIMDLQLCPGIDLEEVNKTFISTALYKSSIDEPLRETLLTLFHFLPEEYDTNLYKMFNVLLYPDDRGNDIDSDDETNMDDETQPENSLKNISPFITVILNELDESTEDNLSLPEGIDIPFEFYPQLYTKTCKDQLIKHIIDKRKNAQFELKSLLNDLNKLKSYQGKDILMFLNSTLGYLQKEENNSSEKDIQISSIIQQISAIKEQMNNKKTLKKDQYKDITQKLHNEWNLSYPELHIIETAKKLKLIDCPYLLTMVVISPTLYYMRDRTDNAKWTEVRCSTISTDFQIIKSIDKSHVKNSIKQHTKVPSETPIMFIYLKEDFMIDEQTHLTKLIENNEGCQQFHKSDQLTLLTNK